MNTLRRNNKLMALLLSVAMVVSLFPGLALWSVDKSYADTSEGLPEVDIRNYVLSNANDRAELKNRVNRVQNQDFKIVDLNSGSNLLEMLSNKVYELDYPDCAYSFKVKEGEETDYENWFADFTVSFDNNVAKDSMGLVGYYDYYKTALGFFAPQEIPKNKEIPLLNSAMKAPDWRYGDIRAYVNEFICGAFNYEEENVGTKMTVSLKLFDPDTFKKPKDIYAACMNDELNAENSRTVETVEYILSGHNLIPARTEGDNKWPRLEAAGIAQKNTSIPAGYYYLENGNFILADNAKSVAQATEYFQPQLPEVTIDSYNLSDSSDRANLKEKVKNQDFSIVDLNSGSTLFEMLGNKVYKLDYPDCAYLFKVKEDEETYYEDWYADFTVSFDEPVAKDSMGLVGYYDDYETALGFFAPQEIPKDTKIPLLNSALKKLGWKYGDIRAYVKEFICGAFNYEEENVGTKMTVSLMLFNPDKFDSPEAIKNACMKGELTAENSRTVETVEYTLSGHNLIPARTEGDNKWPRLEAAGIAQENTSIPDGYYYLENGNFIPAESAESVDQATEYFQPQESTVIATSELVNAAGDVIPGATVANITGGGLYSIGQSATLTTKQAVFNQDVEFEGWYNKKTGNRESSNETYVFPVTEAIELVAKYKAAENAVVDITVKKTGAATMCGKITINETEMSGESKSLNDQPLGQTVSMTASVTGDNAYFICWQNSEGSILSTNTTYKCPAVQSETVEALFLYEGAAVVYFHDEDSSLLKSKVYAYSDSDKVTQVVAPTKRGRTFINWIDNVTHDELNDNQVAIKIKESAEELGHLGQVKVTAKYSNNQYYTVSLILRKEDGTLIGGDGKILTVTNPVGVATKLSADAESGTYKLQGFSKDLTENNYFTTAQSFTISPDEATDTPIVYYAVYGSENVERGAAVTVAHPYDASTNKKKIGLTLTWSLPEKAQLDSAGFYYGSTVAILNSKDKALVSTIKESAGSYTLVLNMQNYLTQPILMRGYVTYKLGGQTYTVVNTSFDKVDSATIENITNTKYMSINAPDNEGNIIYSMKDPTA